MWPPQAVYGRVIDPGVRHGINNNSTYISTVTMTDTGWQARQKGSCGIDLPLTVAHR